MKSIVEESVFQEFKSSVFAVLDKHEQNNISLEDYLLALWAVIEKYKNQKPSYQLFAIMIDEAFEAPPSKFDEQWIAYENHLSWTYKNGSYVIEKYKDGEQVIIQSNVDDYEILKHTILYQIVDFRKLSPDKIKDPQSFFGIDSGKGDTWYNFTPIDYWSCAIRGMEDHLKSPVSLYAANFSKCTWAVFAALLSLGQVYE
jgi:hypothetical protein